MTEPTSTGPFAPFEWMLSLRYLRARRREGFISVIAGFSLVGIMLGVATLIIVMAVMNGFRKELLDKILGLNGHMMVQPLDRSLTDYDAVAERIAKVPGVLLAAPFVEGQALASSPSGLTGAPASGVLVRGMRGEDLERLRTIARNIKQGSLDNFDEGQGVMIGQRLGEQLSLRAGDSITLVSPRGVVTPMGVTPRVKSYKIAAEFQVGMVDYDTGFVFMPLKEAQIYFGHDKDASAIEVYVRDPDDVAGYAALIKQAAGRPVFVADWRRKNSAFFIALNVERNVMFVIVTLIVLVAALNIVSGLIMLVKDKSSDIAILRTMGATQWSILRVFVITGASIGVVGTLLGFVAGTLVCVFIEPIHQFFIWLLHVDVFNPEIYFLSKLPAEMSIFQTFLVVVMALALSLLATIYPAWRAARLDPVEALRYE